MNFDRAFAVETNKFMYFGFQSIREIYFISFIELTHEWIEVPKEMSKEIEEEGNQLQQNETKKTGEEESFKYSKLKTSTFHLSCKVISFSHSRSVGEKKRVVSLHYSLDSYIQIL